MSQEDGSATSGINRDCCVVLFIGGDWFERRNLSRVVMLSTITRFSKCFVGMNGGAEERLLCDVERDVVLVRGGSLRGRATVAVCVCGVNSMISCQVCVAHSIRRGDATMLNGVDVRSLACFSGMWSETLEAILSRGRSRWFGEGWCFEVTESDSDESVSPWVVVRESVSEDTLERDGGVGCEKRWHLSRE